MGAALTVQADHLNGFRRAGQDQPASREIVYALFGRTESDDFDGEAPSHRVVNKADPPPRLIALDALDRRKPQDRWRHLHFGTRPF